MKLRDATHALLHAAAVYASFNTCTNEWHPTATVHSVPCSFPQKKSAEVKSLLNWPSPENFLATSSCFECNTYHIMALDWQKKERKKK